MSLATVPFLGTLFPNRSPHPTNKNASVHGARGLLALTVMLFHVCNSGLHTFGAMETGFAKNAFCSLQSAVEIFFCISGYVITGSLGRAPSAASFLSSRLWRIMPLLWITVTVTFGMEIVARRWEVSGFNSSELMAVYAANLMALPGIVPIRLLHDGAWSISYELAFYLLCACAWKLSRNGRSHWAFTVPVGITMVVIYPRALFFVAGMLVRSGVRHPVIEKAARFPGACLLAFLGLWLAVRVLSGGSFDAGMFEWIMDERALLTPLAFVAALAAFQGIVAGSGWLGTLLKTGIMQRLGTISFSFYLWQFPLMGLVKAIMVKAGVDQLAGCYAQVIFLAASFTVTATVATISQALIEERLPQLLQRRPWRIAPLPAQSAR